MPTTNTQCAPGRVCLFGGLATSDEMWRPLLNRLPGDIEVLYLRLPDAQRELQDQQPLCVPRIARYFTEKLAANHPTTTHLIGFSLGSWVAQGVCLQLPQSPRTLTLIGSSDHIYSHGVSIVSDWIQAIEQIDFDAAISGIFNWMFGPDSYEQVPKLKAYFKQAVKISGVSSGLLKEQLDIAAAFVEGFDLSKISTPTLVMRGESDILFPLHAAKKLRDQIRGAEFTAVPKSGHAALLENSEFCAQAVSEFIRKHSPADSGLDR